MAWSVDLPDAAAGGCHWDWDDRVLAYRYPSYGMGSDTDFN